MNEVLPTGWAVVPLASVAHVQLGKMLSAAAKTGRGARPYLRNINVRWHRVDVDDVFSMDFNEREVEKFTLRSGDVLVCEGGEPGRAAVWRDQMPGALYQKALHRVRFVDDTVDPSFFVYQLELIAATGELASGFTGSTIKHLPREVFVELALRIAPIAEQRRIVAALEEHLSALDAAVAGLRRARANALRYRDAVRAAAVERFGVECVRTVGECAAPESNSITDGPFGSKLKSEHYRNTGPRVVRLQNIGDGAFIDAHSHISAEHFETLRKHQVFGGDVVIAALGETLPRACVIPDWVGPAIVKADCIRFKPDPELMLSAFANIVLNAEPIRKTTTASVHGVGRPRLNLSEVKAVRIPVPSLDAQRECVSDIEGRLGLAARTIDDINVQLARSSRLRQSILQRAFSGGLVPQDPAEAPASVAPEHDRTAQSSAPASSRPTRGRARASRTGSRRG